MYTNLENSKLNVATFIHDCFFYKVMSDNNPLSEANFYSRNSVNSNNTSNSNNSTSSNVVNYGPLIIVPPDNVVALSEALSRMTLHATDGECTSVEEGSLLMTHRPQDGSSEHEHNVLDQANHRRTESATAEYTPRWTRHEALGMKSFQGTTCWRDRLSIKNLELPKDMADYIKQYIRAQFRVDRSAWISLWVPSQGCKPGPKPIPRRSIGIGDVGYFDGSGGFEILFNLYMSEEANLRHGYNPPINFIHYAAETLESQSMDRYMKYDYRCRMISGNLEVCERPPERGKGTPILSIKTPRTKDPMQGAVLFLPDGMVHTTILSSALVEMQSYLNLHAAEWYGFYKTHLRQDKKICNGSLLLVTAAYKSKTWAMASFTKDRSFEKQEVRLNLYKADPSLDVYTWVSEGPIQVQVKTGPSLEEMNNGQAHEYTQCVALEVSSLKIKKRAKGFMESMQSFMSFSRTSRISTTTITRSGI